MYKFTMTASKDIFGKKLGNWYHFHAIGDKKDIIIAGVKDIPYNKDFLNWLKVAMKKEKRRKAHLTTDNIAELIELFQEYEEKDENAPCYPYIEKFSKIMMSN